MDYFGGSFWANSFCLPLFQKHNLHRISSWPFWFTWGFGLFVLFYSSLAPLVQWLFFMQKLQSLPLPAVSLWEIAVTTKEAGFFFAKWFSFRPILTLLGSFPFWICSLLIFLSLGIIWFSNTSFFGTNHFLFCGDTTNHCDLPFLAGLHDLWVYLFINVSRSRTALLTHEICSILALLKAILRFHPAVYHFPSPSASWRGFLTFSGTSASIKWSIKLLPAKMVSIPSTPYVIPF